MCLWVNPYTYCWEECSKWAIDSKPIHCMMNVALVLDPRPYLLVKEQVMWDSFLLFLFSFLKSYNTNGENGPRMMATDT